MSSWILDYGEELRAKVSARRWRRAIDGLDLAWVHQLAWQSVEYTQTLGLQWAMCNDATHRALHAGHAADEADHSDQLRQWMEDQLLLVETPFLGVPPTDETVVLMAFNTRVAIREPFPIRVGVLNVVGEGVALDVFTAAINVLAATGRLEGPHAKFWRKHRAVDGDHLQIGVSEIAHLATKYGPVGERVMAMMNLAAELYGDMLDSWFR